MIWAVVAFFAVWFAGRILPAAGAGAIHLLLGAYFAHLAVRAIYLSIKYKRMIYL
jgi:hypothetical protein